MKFSQLDDSESRLKLLYSNCTGLIRIGMLSVFWSIAMFIAGFVAFLLIKAVLNFLHIFLDAIGKI